MFITFGTTRVRLNHISVISDPFNAGENFGSYCHTVRIGLISGEDVVARFNTEAGADSCTQTCSPHWKPDHGQRVRPRRLRLHVAQR